MSSPIKSDALEIVSGGAANPKIVAGTADPTAGFSGPEGSVYLRYGAGIGRLYVKTGPTTVDWDLAVVGPGGGGSLDTAYDFGGAGAGRTITADTGSVQIDATTSNGQAALTVTRTPGGAAASVGIDLSLNANINASGVGLQVTDAGAGTSIKIDKSSSGSAVQANLSNAGAKALEVVVTAAPTSVSPVSIVANTTGTTVDLLSISKIPGAATAGNALSVSMGANTSGSGIYVSQAGTGPAIEVAAGAIQVANSAAAVSPASTGRIRYNSGTQTFQVSLNGAAYVDIATGAGFTLDIGDAIGSSTVGSVLFVGAGNALQQNNANFFWDDTNNRLGLGTTAPDSSLDIRNATTGISKITLRSTVTTGFADIQFFDSSSVVKMAIAHGNSTSGGSGQNRNFIVTYSDFLIQGSTADLLTLYHATGNLNLGSTLTDPSIKFRIEASTASAGIEIGSGSTLAVSTASTGRYRYNSTGQKFQASLNGGTYGDVLAGDGLTFDSTNKRVGIGAATPLCLLDIRGGTVNTHTIHLRGGATTNDGGYITAAAADQLMLSGGASYDGGAFTARTTAAQWLLMSGGGYALYGDTGLTSGVAYTPTFRFGIGSDGGVDIATSAAAVSAAGVGRFKYIANKLQVSFNTGAYADVGTYAAALTAGSIVFANASNQLAQDNANLFWDATNKSLGLRGTPSVSYALTLFGGTTGGNLKLLASANSHDSGVEIADSAATVHATFSYSNSLSGNVSLRSKSWLWHDTSTDFSIIGATAGSPRWDLFIKGSDGKVGIGTSAPGVNLDISSATNALIRVIGDNDNVGADAGYTGLVISKGSTPTELWFIGRDGTTPSDNLLFRSAASTDIAAFTSTGRLGIGTTAPSLALDTRISATGASVARLTNTHASGYSALEFFDTTPTLQQSVGYGNSTVGVTHIQSKGYLYSATGKDWVIADATAVRFAFDMTNFRFGIGTATPGYQLDLRRTATNTTFHIRSGATTDDGGFLTSTNGSELIASGGAIYDGTNFIAKNANATFVSLNAATVSFYTDTGLTIGNTFTPTQRLNLKSDGGLAFLNSSAAVVGPSTEARLRYSGTKLQVSNGGAAYADAALLAAALTTGSVLFANSGGNLAQDNANLFWDDTNNRLGIGTNTSVSGYPLTVKGESGGTCAGLVANSTASYGAVDFFNSASVKTGGIGYGGSATGGFAANRVFLFTNSVDFVFSTATTVALSIFDSTQNINIGPTQTDPSIKLRIEAATASAGIQLGAGTTLAVSSANTGRLRYIAEKFQISANATAYLDVALMAAALTTGSIPFANSSGNLAQDNANLFWDNTNKRLGIGTASPTYTLDLQQNAAFYTRMRASGAAVGDSPFIILEKTKGTNASPTAVAVGNILGAISFQGYTDAPNEAARIIVRAATGWGATGADSPGEMSFETTPDGSGVPVERLRLDRDGGVTIGTIGNSFFHIEDGASSGLSTSNAGRLRYLDSASRFQVSKNTAAYEDVATLATAQTFTKSQNVLAVALTDVANIATDASLGNIFTVTLGGNRTLDNPTNLVAGGVYRWAVTQDGTGSRTLAYGALFKWPGGTAPTLTATAGAIDSITAIYDGSVLLANFLLNYL